MAWYLVESQTIPNLDAVLTTWQAAAWRFVESSIDTLRSGAQPSHTAHRVARLVLTQDYAEGGRRCLDVELFSRALRTRSVRRLFEPGTHPVRNLPYHWIRASYSALSQNPQTLLLSSCDFTQLTNTIKHPFA